MSAKESSNYKKSFLVSLIAVLLISSLAVCMFAGQAMGQKSTTVDEASITRINAALVITACLFILIVTLFAMVDRRKTAGIDPNKIKPMRGYYSWAFLAPLTVGYYPLYFWAKFTAKLNVMSNHVFGDSVKQTKLSTAAIAACMTAVYSPFIFLFVNGIAINTAAHTAIFNRDITALAAAVVESTGGLGVVFDSWLGLAFIGGIIGVIIYGAIVTVHIHRIGNITKVQLIALLGHYADYDFRHHINYDNKDDDECYNKECYDILKKYEQPASIFVDDGGMKPEHDALKTLIKCHNATFK